MISLPAMASGAEEDIVVLVLTDPWDAALESPAHEEEKEEEEEEEVDLKKITISTSEVRTWDVPRILRCSVVRVSASRSRLIRESRYFRSLLYGNFSESFLSHVPVQYNLRAFISVLQCICGCTVDVEPENFLTLLEGALYFGVEDLLSECKVWFQKITSFSAAHSLQMPLDTVIEVWNYSSEHGVSFISEICAAYLAQNFVWVITCSSFVDVPYDLLHSCLDHPDLTVHSEKQLCEALLLWITSHTGKSSKWPCDSEQKYISILKKARIRLLPLAYSAGKRRSCYFSSFANDSINATFDLIKVFPAKLSSVVTDNGSDMKIRLTQCSEKIDLSGCAHLTVDLLYLAVFPTDVESIYRKRIIQDMIQSCHQHGASYRIMKKLPTMMSFKTVSEVDMSKCPRLHFGAVISFLCLSFPSLQTLRLSYCSHFKTEDLFSLVQHCPSINDVDLTVDISPVIPSRVSISSEISDVYRALDSSPYATLLHQPVVSNITKLTLDGRTDLDDLDLLNVSALSSSLCYLSISGCITLTDIGISMLIQECPNIQSIIVSYTFFGMNSILVLCSEKEHPNSSLGLYQDYEYSHTTAFSLQQLHMDGCKGIEARYMKQLMRCLFMLKSLSLRETSLADNVFCEYKGFLLERLDISETSVSFAALGHVLRRNLGIRLLKISGCRNLYDIGAIGLGFNGDASCKGLYSELIPRCFLDEVAFGWGFDSSSITKIKVAVGKVRAITLGLGASLDLSLLPEICPFVETLILKFQVISDKDLTSILKSLCNLKVLDICCCLGDLTAKSLQISTINLKSLRLERVTPWMTNEDLAILTERCPNLTELSLSGCKFLDSDAQRIISSGWPGLAVIHLEDCGNITSAGISFLLDCVAIEDLLLRHNGRGIRRNVISDAAMKLPLLRKVALDICDACEGGFDSPSYTEKFFLNTVKIARCKPQRCSFNLENLGTFRPVHKDTIVQVWNSKELRTTYVEERI